ncbi:MAG: hypothetical protein ABL912_01650 [Novosphingobium sp.]
MILVSIMRCMLALVALGFSVTMATGGGADSWFWAVLSVASLGLVWNEGIRLTVGGGMD